MSKVSAAKAPAGGKVDGSVGEPVGGHLYADLSETP